MADLQTLNSAIDELTSLRQKEAAQHGAEIIGYMREKAKAELERDALKVELNSMVAERDQAQKEQKRLLRKVRTLQDQLNGVDGAVEAEENQNHFSQTEHYREM